jgi:flagellar export protein FliJ
MKRFRFQLEALLQLRENQRDLRRITLAEVLRRKSELDQQRHRVESERRAQLDDLRDLGTPGEVNIDASSARRLYAGQLDGDLGSLAREMQLVVRQVDLCRQALIEADRSVKSLEKLSHRRREEFLFDQERREALELEQAWRARHAAGGLRT